MGTKLQNTSVTDTMRGCSGGDKTIYGFFLFLRNNSNIPFIIHLLRLQYHNITYISFMFSGNRTPLDTYKSHLINILLQIYWVYNTNIFFFFENHPSPS